ncbi:MAG: DUF134 domain-containing protein [Ruthenibacterium sp.]
MARPIKRRRICQLPQTAEFAPCNRRQTACVALAVDEYETIRLIDALGFTQEECAAQMNVARTTVQAMYDLARKKLADAVVNGKRLVIRGGHYDLCGDAAHCCGKNCNRRSCSARCGEQQLESCRSCLKVKETK